MNLPSLGRWGPAKRRGEKAGDYSEVAKIDAVVFARIMITIRAMR